MIVIQLLILKNFDVLLYFHLNGEMSLHRFVNLTSLSLNQSAFCACQNHGRGESSRITEQNKTSDLCIRRNDHTPNIFNAIIQSSILPRLRTLWGEVWLVNSCLTGFGLSSQIRSNPAKSNCHSVNRVMTWKCAEATVRYTPEEARNLKASVQIHSFFCCLLEESPRGLWFYGNCAATPRRCAKPAYLRRTFLKKSSHQSTPALKSVTHDFWRLRSRPHHQKHFEVVRYMYIVHRSTSVRV